MGFHSGYQISGTLTGTQIDTYYGVYQPGLELGLHAGYSTFFGNGTSGLSGSWFWGFRGMFIAGSTQEKMSSEGNFYRAYKNTGFGGMAHAGYILKTPFLLRLSGGAFAGTANLEGSLARIYMPSLRIEPALGYMIGDDVLYLILPCSHNFRRDVDRSFNFGLGLSFEAGIDIGRKK